MKAVILAAGISSRLRPLTDNTPKCLLKVGEKSILELTIDNIIANDFADLIIVTGYLEEKIKNFVSNKYPDLNVTYIYNEVYGSTNNIYSLWLTKESVLEDELLLMDCDIIFDKEIITKLLASEYESCLALKRHNVQDEEIKVKTGENGRVLEIGKEVKLQDATGESIGIEKFGVETLKQLFIILERKIVVEKNANQFYEAAFQEMADKGANIYTVDTTDYICMEIDTIADLEAARLILLNQH
ncbi:MAG TPA: phosphocholine cytidylyltransferase family protein [Hanamia sp.]|nr:phosphocholine cytidylyltransferase family protein [Hanamia sp.]